MIRGRTRGITAAALAVLLGAADTYVVVLLLPEIMTGVGLDSSELQRAAPLVSGFLLGYVAALPAAGRLSDLIGRRAVLLGCLWTFAAGAVITASAHDLSHAVAGRLLQGVGAGGLVPVTLALVADRWSADERAVPLGVVGGVQEAGAVLGPLVGAAVLAIGGWRAVFWGGAGLSILLSIAVGRSLRASGQRRRAVRDDLVGTGLLGLAALAGALAILSPARLVDDVTFGELWVKHSGVAPITAASVLLLAAFAGWEIRAPRPLLRLRQSPTLGREVDAVGLAIAAVALGAIVLAFAGADPERSALADSGRWLLAAAGGALALLAVRERTARTPFVPRGAIGRTEVVGSLVVSFLVGVGLVGVLVDVPVYARTTVHSASQLDAALVLVRFLAAVPVGAVVGGWLTSRWGRRRTAGLGLLLAAVSLAGMSRWGQHALTQQQLAANAALVAAGLGFGLAVAPVNAAALARAGDATHGILSGLVIVARTTGMLVGLSVLSAVGLRVYAERAAKIASPGALCPDTPLDCAPFKALIRAAVVAELRVIFAAAAVCLVVAAVACVTLRARREAA